MNAILASGLFAALVAHAAAFQLVLAAGAPLGHLALGGHFKGALPPLMRAAAVAQAILLAALGVIVLARAGLILPGLRELAGPGAWVAVGVSALSLVANLATPNRWERRLWAPVAALMLATSWYVASS